MKRIILLPLIAGLLLAASAAFGQGTTIAPGGAIFDATTGAFRGFVNRATGREETLIVPGQLRTAQATAPTCSTNCGTSPSIAGTDTAGIVTMGSSGSPASGWVVTFNGTWLAAPACTVQSYKNGMVTGKKPIVVVTSTTTFTVTTDGTAPATGDQYAYQCIGVQ